jgi:hypothetical protein
MTVSPSLLAYRINLVLQRVCLNPLHAFPLLTPTSHTVQPTTAQQLATHMSEH